MFIKRFFFVQHPQLLLPQEIIKYGVKILTLRERSLVKGWKTTPYFGQF